MSRTALHGACVLGLLAGAGLLPAGCPSGGLPPPINVAPGLQAEYLVADAAQPAALAFAPDGRVFYTEKNTGRIRIIKDGALLEIPFAEVPVNSAGDRGLLGIALHPAFELNHRVYVFYSRSDTGTSTDDPRAIVDHRVVYFEAADDLAGGEIFVTSIPAGELTERIGGRIAFSPQGLLYVATGDQGEEFAAQEIGLLGGKVLRFNDDGTDRDDNPLPGWPVYARGLRDPQGMALDPITLAPHVTDRQPQNEHEINLIVADGDYGWPAVVGVADTAAELAYAAEHPEYHDPILDSGTSTDPLVGGGFNPDIKYSGHTRLYFFYARQRAGLVFNLEPSQDRMSAVARRNFAGGLPTPITDVAFTPAGTLYVASEDAILRVVVFATEP